MPNEAEAIPLTADLHAEVVCSFCGTQARFRRVTLYSEVANACICDVCATTAAKQAADIIAQRDKEQQYD